MWWYDEYRYKVYSGIIWKEEGDTYIQNPPGVGFSLPPNATGPNDPTTEELLFKYGNGVSLRYEYRLYVTQDSVGETYHLNYMFLKLYDKDYNLITQASAGGGTARYLPTHPIAPWSNLQFVPGMVRYSTNNPTIIGEECTQVWFAAIWNQNHTQLLPVPFAKKEHASPFSII